MASATNPTFSDLRRAIAAKRLSPVYLLHGEEGYFIDELTKDFEAAIPEDERDFNLHILYASEITPELVDSICRRYPIMANMQVVILKEAQALRSDQLNKLYTYAANPNKSTVLVICCRGTLAKGKDLIREIKANGVIFEAKKLKDRNLTSAVADIVQEMGLHIDGKGLAMLCDHIGTDVSRMYNEIGKLALILGKGATITPESIERNVGISKDYNNFELIDAIAQKDARKIFEIIKYFKNDPKHNPTILTVSTLFTYFSNLLISHFTRDKSAHSLMETLGFKWQSQLKSINVGLRNYNAYKTIEIISAIREFDTKSKGISSRQPEFDLLHDLMYRILTATGNIAF